MDLSMLMEQEVLVVIALVLGLVSTGIVVFLLFLLWGATGIQWHQTRPPKPNVRKEG